MIEALLSVLIAMVAIPFVVYLSVKLGTYAFFRGKQLFEEKQNGEKQK